MCAQLRRVLLCIVVVASSGALGYPDDFLKEHTNNNNCTEHPLKAYGQHGQPEPDRSTTMLLTPKFSLDGAPKNLCPGAQYSLKVTFTAPRLGLLTSSAGTFASALDPKCPNRIITPDKSPVKDWQTTFSVPCSSAGQDILFKVTSTDKATSSYKTSVVTLLVAPTSGACAGVSGHCDGGSVAIPVSKFDPNQGTVDIDGMAPGVSLHEQPPVYSMQPVLPNSNGLWQFLHALLMLAAFGFLLPLGVLLARHKWMFGRNPDTSKVSSSWFYLHVITQICGIVAGLGGFAIALLAFGWKAVPGQALYLPHKWMGIAVLGMVLIQLLVAPLQPSFGARARSCWNLLHWNWGRLTILGGAGNTVLGALLLHDYKGHTYMVWLVASCAVIGAMCILALVLEAFKLQMQRTYRYHPKTKKMLPVYEGHKQSKRRSSSSSPEQQHLEQPMYPSSERSDDTGAVADIITGGQQQYPRVQYGTGMPTAAAPHLLPADQALGPRV